MALVIGHSQAKYLSEYFYDDSYQVFSYPGYRTRQFLDENIIYEASPHFSVSILLNLKMQLYQID